MSFFPSLSRAATDPGSFLDWGLASAFAHRGDRANHPPGNHWTAFQSAIDVGFDHIESDVHLTADGQLVLFHDDELDDETTGSGTIRDHPWSELESVRYRTEQRELDEGLVRLADALERWPEVRWNLDAKHDATVEPLLELTESTGSVDRVLLTSFSYRTLRRIRSLAPPGLCTGVSGPEAVVIKAASLLGATPPHFGEAAQVPVEQRGITVVDRRYVAACHRAGIAVHVWTVNEADEMHRLFDLGVDGIVTDDPPVLRSVLEERGVIP